VILTEGHVEDFDKFWQTFSTKGHDKRKEHGSKGSHVFRDADDPNHILIIFDWDEAGFDALLADPDMKAIFAEAGLKGRPQLAQSAGELDA
jgi:quinol monooxygenase YgiN